MRPGIETGILRVRGISGKESEKAYVITHLDENDLPRIMALQDLIFRHLHCWSLLERFSSEFMREHLGRKGFALGVFSQGALVGFRNVYFPDAQEPEWNLGRDIGLPGPQLTRVANLQMVCVHPDYRGNRLALKMNRIALRLLRQGGNHDHICATVSPLNIWNISILLESGFHIRGVKPKYGGKMRYILYQRLKDPTRFRKRIKAAVALNDLETQKRLLGARYYAVDMVTRGKAIGTISADITLRDLIFRQPIEAPGVHPIAKRQDRQVSAGQQKTADLPLRDSVPFQLNGRIDGDLEQ